MSYETNTLIHANKDLLKKIKQDHLFYDQAAPERKNLDYVKKRLESLEQHWEQFVKNDDQIRADVVLDGNAPYFFDGCFDEAKDAYAEYGKKLATLRTELEKKDAEMTKTKTRSQAEVTTGTSRIPENADDPFNLQGITITPLSFTGPRVSDPKISNNETSGEEFIGRFSNVHPQFQFNENSSGGSSSQGGIWHNVQLQRSTKISNSFIPKVCNDGYTHHQQRTITTGEKQHFASI